MARRSLVNRESVRRFINGPMVPLDAVLDEFDEWLRRDPPRPEEHYLTWTPTPDAIDRLPEPVRQYVRDLQDAYDPAGVVQELQCRRAQVEALFRFIADVREDLRQPPRWRMQALARIRRMAAEPRGKGSTGGAAALTVDTRNESARAVRAVAPRILSLVAAATP